MNTPLNSNPHAAHGNPNPHLSHVSPAPAGGGTVGGPVGGPVGGHNPHNSLNLHRVAARNNPPAAKGWGMLALGLVAGVASMHMMVGRPMSHDLGRLEQQVGQLDRKLQRLVGHEDEARQGAGLLAMLAQQGEQLEVARQALSDLQHLREGLSVESVGVERAYGALDRLAALKNRAVLAADDMDAAQSSLADLENLRDQVICGREETNQALAAAGRLSLLTQQVMMTGQDAHHAQAAVDEVVSLNDTITQARTSAAQAARLAMKDQAGLQSMVVEAGQQSRELGRSLAALQTETAVKADEVRESLAFLGDWRQLFDGLMDGRRNMLPARRAVSDLTDLQDKILELGIGAETSSAALVEVADVQDSAVRVAQVSTIARQSLANVVEVQLDVIDLSAQSHVAREAVSRLHDLQQQIVKSGVDQRAAAVQLDSLVEMQNQLISNAEGLADAVQSLETFEQLHQEFTSLEPTFTQMRRSLMEVTLLETQFNRTLQMLAPLSELVNLHRLDRQELQQAVRRMVEQRAVRLGQAPAERRD